jgi:hypothetical protein
VQLQKKTVEVERLHTFSRFGTRASQNAQMQMIRARHGDLSCGILQTIRGEVEASCSSPWSNAKSLQDCVLTECETYGQGTAGATPEGPPWGWSRLSFEALYSCVWLLGAACGRWARPPVPDNPVTSRTP